MKTTACGSLTILAALVNVVLAVLKGTPIDLPTTITAITAGIGLIKAQDQFSK